MTEITQQKDQRKQIEKPIIVVSGLPRSGTSMMMQMLDVGGIKIFSDQIRTADIDNPKGYFELERVKELDKSENKSWLGEAKGSAVKIISQLLKELPSGYFYKIIFMNRNLKEIIASQNKMLQRRGQLNEKSADDKIHYLFEKHLVNVKTWLEQQAGFDILEIEYTDILANPVRQAARLRDFLGVDLNIKNMGTVVDEKLYRNRR